MTLLRKYSATVLAVMAALCIAGSARADVEFVYPALNTDPSPDAGYVYYYDSFVQFPADTFIDYYYYWEAANFSTNLDVVSWTYGGGDVFALGDYTGDPMPFQANAGDPRVWGFSDHFYMDPPIAVKSEIAFSDGHKEIVDIYVPTSLVPEPSSIIGLLSGLGGLGILIRRKQ